MSRKAYLWLLGTLYAAWWVLMAINPLDRHDWYLENALVVFGLGLLVWTYKSFPLSRVSYTCIFWFGIRNCHEPVHPLRTNARRHFARPLLFT